MSPFGKKWKKPGQSTAIWDMMLRGIAGSQHFKMNEDDLDRKSSAGNGSPMALTSSSKKSLKVYSAAWRLP